MPALTTEDILAHYWRGVETKTSDSWRVRRGGRWHTGSLSGPGHHGGGPRIRDDRRGPRSQYTSIFQRDIDAGDVQVKVGSRYVDVCTALPRASELNAPARPLPGTVGPTAAAAIERRRMGV